MQKPRRTGVAVRLTLAAAGLTVGAAALFATGIASAQEMTLKASHQWPGGKGDVRDEMVQIIAREVAAADVGLKIQVYPGASLYKAYDQDRQSTRLNSSH